MEYNLAQLQAEVDAAWRALDLFVGINLLEEAQKHRPKGIKRADEPYHSHAINAVKSCARADLISSDLIPLAEGGNYSVVAGTLRKASAELIKHERYSQFFDRYVS